MQKFLGILAVSVLLSAPASAAVVLGGPETLSATPFTFGPSAADQFSLSLTPRAGSSPIRSFRRREPPK
jgi:hypothetical protein